MGDTWSNCFSEIPRMLSIELFLVPWPGGLAEVPMNERWP